MNKFKLNVEQIENGIAKCEKEDGTFVEIEVSSLPDGVKCGDILLYQNGEYSVSKEQTDEQKKKMLDIQSRLFNKKK
ncbi:MAG: DUF3006 domain-containing protein [Acutalibacteraceae bacterium]